MSCWFSHQFLLVTCPSFTMFYLLHPHSCPVFPASCLRPKHWPKHGIGCLCQLNLHPNISELWPVTPLFCHMWNQATNLKWTWLRMVKKGTNLDPMRLLGSSGIIDLNAWGFPHCSPRSAAPFAAEPRFATHASRPETATAVQYWLWTQEFGCWDLNISSFVMLKHVETWIFSFGFGLLLPTVTSPSPKVNAENTKLCFLRSTALNLRAVEQVSAFGQPQHSKSGYLQHSKSERGRKGKHLRIEKTNGWGYNS